MVWLRVRRWVVRPIFWAFAILALVALGLRAFLASDFVAGRLARLTERELSRVAGRPVRIGGLEFELLPTSVVLHDLLVPSDSPGDPPFLTIRRLLVELDSDALSRDLVDVQTVYASGVRGHLVLREDGGDNLPRFPAGETGSSPLAVRIGGLYVEDAELDLGDRRVPLDVRARAVLVRLAGLGGTELQGTVTAQEVETLLPGARPWPATVSGKIRLEGDRVEILHARVASAELDARVSGTIGWKGGTHGELRGTVEASAAWLDERGYLDGEIVGDLRFDGKLRFARRELRLEGTLASPALALFGVRVDDLEGALTGDRERLELAIEHGDYRSGALDGSFAVDLRGEESNGEVALVVEGAPVRELLRDLGLPDFRVAATAHGELSYRFPFSRSSRGVGSASFELVAVPQDSGRPDLVEVDGVVGLEISAGQLRIPELALRAGKQTIDGSGEFVLVDGGGRFDAAIESGDLAELANLQTFVATSPAPLWLPTSGRGEIELHARTSAVGSEVDLRFDLSSVSAPGIGGDRIRGALTVDGSSVRGLDLAVLRDEARLRVSGALPWSGGGGAVSTSLDVTLERWPVEDAWAWSPVTLPIAGPVDGLLTLRGSLEALAGELTGTISPVDVASIDAERLDVALRWDDERLVVDRVVLASPAGEILGAGALRFEDEALDFHLSSAGLDLSRSPFRDLARARAAGLLEFEAQVAGTTAAPEATIRGEIGDLALVGRALSGDGATTLSATLLDGRLDLVLDMPELATMKGGGSWSPGESAQLRFSVASGRLERWIELGFGAPIDELSGTLAAEVEIAQQRGEPWVAALTASRLSLLHRGRAAELLEPAALRLQGDRLEIRSLFLGTPAGHDELFVGGTVDLAREVPALDLRLQATVSIDWLEELAAIDMEGQVELLSTIGGTLDRPAWNGEAALREGRWIPPGFPHTFDRVEALALLYPEAIVLDSTRGDFAGGRLSAFGRIDLPHGDQGLDYRIQAALTDAALRYPEGFLLRGDGELTLQSSAEGRQIRGSIELERADYVQDINLSPTQLVQRFLTRTRLQVEETDDLLSSTYLNVAIDARNALRVRNNLARIDGGGELALRGTLANPVLFGEVVAEPGGTIEYAGNSYELERGIVTFANPTRLVPVVDIVTTTKIDDYEVRLNIAGSLDQLATSFSSNPPLPDYDVLALLATGSPAGDSTWSGTGGGTGSAALAAESLLYGQAATLIGARVGTLFGIDRLKIDPLTTGETVSSARVTVGKRLSRKVFLTYSVDPSSTAQQILEVEWKVADDLTLVLTQNGDGSYALDARWGRRF